MECSKLLKQKNVKKQQCLMPIKKMSLKISCCRLEERKRRMHPVHLYHYFRVIFFCNNFSALRQVFHEFIYLDLHLCNKYKYRRFICEKNIYDRITSNKSDVAITRVKSLQEGHPDGMSGRWQNGNKII